MEQPFLTPKQALKHWQGHQDLTRRVIEAYPEEALFTFSAAPPMRPFGALVLEIIGMIPPTLEGLISGDWEMPAWNELAKEKMSKAELLELWDRSAAVLAQRWSEIPEDTFGDVDTAFGQWTMPRSELLMYLIDNEIHHRAQGYVYLRALGIQPPEFASRF